MNLSPTCTVHRWPPPGHARHGTGSSRTLAERAGHALGRGARLTRVQLERGGSQVLAQAGPGDIMTGPVFPEDSWVQVRYPLTSEQELYRAHPDYGDRSTASRVAAELAAQAGLQPGTARSYLYAELNGSPS